VALQYVDQICSLNGSQAKRVTHSYAQQLLLIAKKYKPLLMSIQLTQIEANLLYPPQGSPIESSAKKLQLLIPSHLNLFKFQKNVRNPFSFSRYRNFCHRKKICS